MRSYFYELSESDVCVIFQIARRFKAIIPKRRKKLQLYIVKTLFERIGSKSLVVLVENLMPKGVQNKVST